MKKVVTGLEQKKKKDKGGALKTKDQGERLQQRGREGKMKTGGGGGGGGGRGGGGGGGRGGGGGGGGGLEKLDAPRT